MAHSPVDGCAALAARCSFPSPGTPITCAVSGGPDSLALLALAAHAECTVTAIHVDHRLRPESGAEAVVVAEAAHRFGAAFRSVLGEVEDGPNLESRARAARWAALPDDARTGHTADDRAETILINLLRGAGSPGLTAMGPSSRRPLLGLRRAETAALCTALDLRPVHDPMNRDPRFVRNRVRHEALPLLAEVAGRDLVPLLLRQADLMGDEVALLAELAEAVDPTDAGALATAPLPLARIAVRRLVTGAEAGRPPPDAATVERVLAVARGEAVATEIGAGWRVIRSRGRLRAEPTG